MKVVFVTNYESEVTLWKAQNNLMRVRHLPCDVVECYDAKRVKKHARDADVVLFDHGYMHVPYWGKLAFLNGSSARLGRFYVDLWHKHEAGAPAEWSESTIRFNFRIVAYKALTKQYRPQWKGNTFWSPHCIDVCDYDLPRDIDILFWGARSVHYPFRRYAYKELKAKVVGDPRRIDTFLVEYAVLLNGVKYRFCEVDFEPNPRSANPTQRHLLYGYYGQRLFRLLSRTKIGITGPAWGVPVGRYFEQAACGCVTLSPDFTDREDLGFVHGENIWLSSKKSLIDDLCQLLSDSDNLSHIATNSKKLIQERHTPRVRGRELYAFLCKRTGIR